jgi:hypothetical protein
MMHCKCDCVPLVQRNNFWPRLHTRTSLGEHKLATRKIPLRLGQQNRDLYWEDVLAVKILMQAVEVAFAIF